MGRPEIAEGKGLWGGRLITFESLPSTNQWALNNIGSCLNGDVVRAIVQTTGRGRFERKWLAPANRCLTISVVIMSDVHADHVISTITQTAALAIRSTLEKYSINSLVKWPNDVLVKGKKIAGILAEGEQQSGAVILGIGLNVNLTEEDLAEVDLLQPATSMAMEKGRNFDIDQVCPELLSELEKTIDVAAQEGTSFLVETWKRYDSLMRKRIEVQTHQGAVSGKYTGLDESGRLRLIDDLGHEHFFWSGDVTVGNG